MGRQKRGGFAPNVRAEVVRRLGQGPMPRARALPYSALLTGRHDCDYVELIGIVQRAWDHGPGRTLFADVAVEGGLVRASFWDYTPADIEWLVGAEVRLAGNAGTLNDETGNLRGLSMLLNRTRDVEVLKPAQPPFSLPVRSLQSLPRAHLGRRAVPPQPGHRRGHGLRARAARDRVGHGQRATRSPRRRTSSTSRTVWRSLGSRPIRRHRPRRGNGVDVVGSGRVKPGKRVLRRAVSASWAPEPAGAVRPRDRRAHADRDARLVFVEARLLARS